MTQRVSRSLASAVVALTLLTGSGLASAQGMALQPIVARMLTAMSAATAYRIVVDSTISGGGTPRGSVTRTHMEMIRVHHGTTTLPVEVDAVGSEALVQGQPPFAVKSTASYSRWNDPTLRVPAVPVTGLVQE